MKSTIRINNKDNVVVALTNISKGDEIIVEGDIIKVLEDIPQGNKIAIKSILMGEDIIKYGYPIGIANKNISKGYLVHTHNLSTKLAGSEQYVYNYSAQDIPKYKLTDRFQGYLRKDGKAGVRNEIWIIPMVGCVNGICRVLEALGKKELLSGELDDIIAFTHQFGCSQLGDDHNNFQLMLKGLANNPNAHSVLFVALGCENNTIESFEKLLGNYDKNRIRFITCQNVQDEIEEGMKVLKELASVAKQCRRVPLPVSKLVVGLKCGGSDGMSGITANPIIGGFSDILTSFNGSTILTEVPEMFGAEQALMNRCVDYNTFNDFISMINDYKNYYIRNNQPIYENPSPGNKKGGITTLEEKSLGCVLKGGSAKIVKVIEYCSTDLSKGLNVMSSPGNDLIAATALAAAGAQIVLFSTGRGTPFSTAVPTVKISSNSELNAFKNKWIDFNAGAMLDEKATIISYSERLYNYVLEIANGKKTKSETYGIKEIAFLKNGVTL